MKFTQGDKDVSRELVHDEISKAKSALRRLNNARLTTSYRKQLSCGKPVPHWSNASEVRALSPLSIAGLPVSNSCVGVIPPLFCSAPSNGYTSRMSVAW